MRHIVIVVASLIVTAYSQHAAACSKDGFEPDFSAPTGAVFVGGTSQQRNFCDDPEDWMSINVCPGRAYSLDTSGLGTAADTLIELYSGDGTTLLHADDDAGPDPTGHLAWIAGSSERGTFHARVRQRDGTHGELRDYEIHLTGDTSPCSIGVTSEVHVAGEFLMLTAIVQSVDGGFVSVGNFTSGGAQPDLAVTRWNNDGTIRWIRGLGDGGSQGGIDVARTPDGGFVALANSSSGPQGSLIVKLTDGGAVSWQRLYGAGYVDALVGIAASTDGSIYAVGYLDAPASAGGYDGWLLKLNALGAPDWSLRVGGARAENLLAIQPLEDGAAVAVGAAAGAGSSYDAILLEVSSAGAIVNQTIFHTNAANTEFRAVRPLAGGGYLVGGSYCGSGGFCNALLLKLTAAGAIDWQRTLNWPYTRVSHTNYVTSIDTLQDGSIYAHVVRDESNVLTGWDPNGTLLWQRSLGTVDGGRTGVVSDDGGIAVAYGTNQSARLVRTDATGYVPYCAAVSPTDGVPGTPALTASALSLGTGIHGEPAPSASFAITSALRSVATTCSCFRTMSTPIYVTGPLNTEISWATDGFGPYDVVRGDLGTLQATGGDFTAALNAIPPDQQCLAQGVSGTVVFDSYAQPLPDTGYFYLARGENGTESACPSVYDESLHQLGHRDPEIAAATGSCP